MDTTEVAGRLARAVAHRTAIAKLTDEFPELDLSAAYRVQRELRADAGPIHGFLPAAAAISPGEPLETSRHIQPRCEPEIVFVLARDIGGADGTAADVLAASSAVAVGIEILDSRFVDYDFTTADVVADNTSASRYLVGLPVSPAGVDLPDVRVELGCNGRTIATATGAACLGDPARAVAWLVRQLAAEGDGLQAGQVVLSGGLTAATPRVLRRRRDGDERPARLRGAALHVTRSRSATHGSATRSFCP